MEKTDTASFDEKEFFPAERIEQLLNEFYQQKEQLTPEAIKEIREELANISAVLINFDETITKESTVARIMAALGLPEEKRQEFQEFIKTQSKAKPEERKSAVQYFYQEVLKGITEEELRQAYQEVIKEAEVNPNLDKILEFFKKQRGITTIPLFLLSLNNKDFLQMYCGANRDFFDRHKVKIAGIAGNQVKTNETGNIIGIIENVNNQNKNAFTPQGAIILTDNRETKVLLTKKVNAVNIQGKSFNEEFLSEAIEYIEDLDMFEVVSKMQEKSDSPKTKEVDEILHDITILLEDNIKLRLSFEENKFLDFKSLEDIRKRRLEIMNRLRKLNIIFGRRK